MRALLVDGQDLFRSALRTLLEAHGASVVGEAQNDHEAVEMTRQLPPEVVLMDLDRLELDGLPAIRLITAEMPEVKVIVLTASKAAADLFEAIKAGAHGYLFKNLKADAFLKLLAGVGPEEPAFTPGSARYWICWCKG
jgi:two-component system NarL family response regulator